MHKKWRVIKASNIAKVTKTNVLKEAYYKVLQEMHHKQKAKCISWRLRRLQMFPLRGRALVNPDLPRPCLFPPKTHIAFYRSIHSLCMLIQCWFQSMHTSMKPFDERLNQKLPSSAEGEKHLSERFKTGPVCSEAIKSKLDIFFCYNCDNSNLHSSYQRPAYAFLPPPLQPQCVWIPHRLHKMLIR